MHKPKESDWRIFRDSLPIWREKYLIKINQQISTILNDPQKTATERFWDIYEFQKKQSKILRFCLDRYSRSSMYLKLHAMVDCGMVTDKDLAAFSDELKEIISFWQSKI